MARATAGAARAPRVRARGLRPIPDDRRRRDRRQGRGHRRLRHGRRSRARRCGGDRRLGHDPPGRQCRGRLGRDRRGGLGRGGRHARGRQRESRRGDPDDGRLDDPLGGRRASHVLDVPFRLAADARRAAVDHRGTHRGGLPRRLDAHRGVSRQSTRALGARRRRDPPGIRTALRPAGRDDHRYPADPGGGAASRRPLPVRVHGLGRMARRAAAVPSGENTRQGGRPGRGRLRPRGPDTVDRHHRADSRGRLLSRRDAPLALRAHTGRCRLGRTTQMHRMTPASVGDAAVARSAVARALVVVAAAVVAGTALVHGQVRGADPIESVTLRSGSYADFRQVFAREAPAGVSVPATLRFPERPRERYPAVVVVHTLGGLQEANEGWLAAELRRSGFATLTYDSFSARGLSQSALIGSRAGPPMASGVADAFAAFQFLAGHPRIAADRIGIVGFSFGGEMAHLTAFESLRAAMGAGPSRFAAHVATYPAGNYGARAEAGAYTGAPILMLLGEKDDNLPVAKVESYLAYASAAGHPAPIATVVYPGAFHAWTVPTLGAPRFYPEYVASPRKCPVILFGRRGPTMLVAGGERPLDPDALAACQAAGSGYSMGYDAATRAKSAADT